MARSLTSIRAAKDDGVKPRAWITRKENAAKRHQKIISITEEGKDAFQAARRDHMRQVFKTLNAVGFRDLIQLRTSLFLLNLALDPTYEPIDSGSVEEE